MKQTGIGRRSRHFALFLFLALPAVLLGTTGCQFIGMDMFPATLSREEAVLDLKGEIRNLGVMGDFAIWRMEFLSSPATGKKYISGMVYAPDSGTKVLVLDPKDLSVIHACSDPAFLSGIDDQGNFFNFKNTDKMYRYDSSTLAAIGSVSLTQTVPYDALSGSDSSTTVIVAYNSVTGDVTYERVTAGTEAKSWTYQLNSSFVSDIQLRSLYFEGGKIRLLFGDTNYSAVQLVTFANITAMDAVSGTVSVDTNAVSVIQAGGDDQYGSLTRDGVLFIKHDTLSRLIRCDSDTGTVLDSFTTSNTGNMKYEFSPDGMKWLEYDALTGKLHLLRTWW
jgi:hypothetical protein